MYYLKTKNALVKVKKDLLKKTVFLITSYRTGNYCILEDILIFS
jgi:hypothetical protein